jgi:asparagine synthase (glutamine-hydrolysing)
MANPAVRPTLDLKSLGLMVAAKLGQGWTMFEGLQLLTFQDGTLGTEKWWRPDTVPRVPYERPQDYVDDVRAIFSAAVATRLRARGEIAATMSGGLDSTLVATTAARQMVGSGRWLDAFTAVPQPGLRVENRCGWDADDAPFAASVVKMHGCLVPAPRPGLSPGFPDDSALAYVRPLPRYAQVGGHARDTLRR